MRNWNWYDQDGNFDGRPSSLTADTEDGYAITVTMQRNTDGVLVCRGLNIQFKDQKNAPEQPINSRFFQLLGLGEILKSFRADYLMWGDTLQEAYTDMDAERETREWPYPGPVGHPDEKYAYLAYMYVHFINLGKESPIEELAKHMNCDRETASSRVAEARRRRLLGRPKQGVFGGKLTTKAEKLLGIDQKRGRKK